MAYRDNYYILTGVSFDPIETNEQKIREAITNKQQEWSNDQNNPLKRNRALENLRALKDIEAVLLDPIQRKKEADQAKIIRKEQLSTMAEKIKITEAKGFIKPKELESIIKKFSPYGISEAEVKRSVSKPISENKPVVTEQEEISLIDSQMAANIEKNFKQLGGSNNTLYSFLGLKESATPAQLLEAADTKRKTLGSKAQKTGNLNAELELAGICLIVFKDRDSKKKYDNYVSVTKYTALNEAIREGAVNNKKEVNPELMETLMDVAQAKYGIRASDASTYIKRFCMINGYIVSGGSKIVCGLCNTENATNAVTCSQCGKPLFTECPSCLTKNGNTAEICTKCRFDLSKMNQAIDLINQAKKCLSQKHVDEAFKLITEAKIYWPNHLDIVAIEKNISEQKQRFGAVLSDIIEEMKARNYYSAKTKIMQATSNGFSIEQSVVDKVENVIRLVESELDKIKSLSGDDAFFRIVELAKEINDSADVNHMIRKFPPQPATDLNCEVKGSEVILTWKPSVSAGVVEYNLIRKKNSFANDENDGESIYQGTETSYSDSVLAKSEEYYYTVFTRRHRVVSIGCRCDKPIVMLPSLENVQAIGGDGIVTLSWKAAKSIAEVKIWKGKSEQRPESVDVCEGVVCNRVDGITITNLENGKKHWFILGSYHSINGNVYSAEPIIISAVPEKPAKPLEDFRIESKETFYTATWTASEWDVILLYSQTKPDFTVGIVYSIDELLKKYQKIDIELKRLNEADFSLNFIGQCYVIPGVINSTNVILNTPCILLNMPDVEQISFDTNAAGNELYINFNWPKKFTKVAVVYRYDTYPEGPEDQLAKHLECTKQQYEYDAAVLLQNPNKGIYYTTIYTVFESDGEKIYSNGIQIMINNEPQRDIYYTFKYKKGILSRKSTLMLTVRAESSFILPKFILSGKLRAMPLTRDDGYLVASVTEDTTISANHTFNFNIDTIPSDTYIKMFFISDRDYKRFRLLNEGASKI